MMTDNWTNTAGGDFNTAANWSAGVPDLTTDVQITANGTYTVTSSNMNEALDLAMARHATLAINGSGFSIYAGTGTGGLAGTIDVNDNTYLALGAGGETTTFANTGTINVQSSFPDAAKIELVAGVTLTGKGKVILAGLNSEITAYSGISSSLTNGTATSGNTISGYGVIGDQTDSLLSFSNGAKGVVNANNGADILKIDTDGGAVSNAGLMEASNDGSLDLHGTVTQSGNGVIKTANSGASLNLFNAAITGGALSIAAGSTLFASGTGSTTDEIITPTKPINNAGVIRTDSANLLVSGSIKGAGKLEVAQSYTLAVGGTVSGSAEITSGKLELLGASSVKVTFDAGAQGTLVLGDATKFTGTVAGMALAPSAAIDLGNILYADIDASDVSYNSIKQLLTVTDPGQGITDKIKIAGMAGTFTAQKASDGTTLIFDPPASPQNAPDKTAQLLAQSAAGFGATSGGAGAPAGGSWNSGGSSDFLAAPHHG